MAYVVGLLVLLVGLLVSIALHEVGHMVPAKRFGVRVSRYMVGFGPTLWSRTRGETEYGLKAIPLGGYVRLVGMFPPADAVASRPRAGRFAELVDEARRASAEEIRPGEEHRAFYRLSTPKKVVVMLGGPLMNLVIAVVLFTAVVVGIGIGTTSTTVGVVAECLRPTAAPVDRECTRADDPTPAAAAGLQPGDQLLSYAGTPIETWSDFQEAVLVTEGAQIPLVVRRGGEEVTLRVTPVVVERPARDEAGEVVLGPDGEVVTEQSRYLGLSPTATLERQPLSAVPPVVGYTVWETAKIVATLPVRLVEVAEAAFGGAPRDPTGVIGIVGVGRVAGEIAAVEAPGFGLAERVGTMLMLLASLNVALFVFNLIPLVPLDGGHVAGALWEGARRQVARLRGRPTPAPADVARMMPLAYGVFLVLAAMGILLIYADLVRPITL